MPPKAGIHEAARREQILQAARACIVALGYERATVRDVAEEAGVSTGTIVHYFGDKDTMLEAALLHKVQDTGIAFRAALAGAQSAWERLERLVNASVPESAEVRDEWRLWLTFWGEVTRNERLRAVSEKQHQRWTRFLARIIAEGCASGEFAAVDPHLTALQMAALIDGLAIQTTLQNPALSPGLMRQVVLAALRRLLFTAASSILT
ncbi:MAG TPA: TetR/AcrR family transcriptional regulator [Ktedonobacteraceae bacterium]